MRRFVIVKHILFCVVSFWLQELCATPTETLRLRPPKQAFTLRSLSAPASCQILQESLAEAALARPGVTGLSTLQPWLPDFRSGWMMPDGSDQQSGSGVKEATSGIAKIS